MQAFKPGTKILRRQGKNGYWYWMSGYEIFKESADFVTLKETLKSDEVLIQTSNHTTRPLILKRTEIKLVDNCVSISFAELYGSVLLTDVELSKYSREPMAGKVKKKVDPSVQPSLTIE